MTIKVNDIIRLETTTNPLYIEDHLSFDPTQTTIGTVFGRSSPGSHSSGEVSSELPLSRNTSTPVVCATTDHIVTPRFRRPRNQTRKIALVRGLRFPFLKYE